MHPSFLCVFECRVVRQPDAVLFTVFVCALWCTLLILYYISFFLLQLRRREVLCTHKE